MIFISVTYAKATDGRLRMNFGPLNGENGWRRLNVLTTRARQRLKVFSCMREGEINSATTTSRGALLLREFLLLAERGKLESVSASLAADTESPFEQNVLRGLTDLGIHVVPQLGGIDLGVLDDVEAAELAALGASLGVYARPVAVPYALTPGDGRYQGDILAAPAGQIVQAVVAVVEHESPIHEADVFTRLASQWSTRAGSRIQARIRDALFSAVQGQVIQLRGEFRWSPRRSCVPRSRAGTRISADRIAPEEYQETVLMVLGSGHGFSRSQLTAEVRSVLGFTRTGEVLDEAIARAVETLIARGSIGEASVGIRIRR